MNFQEKLFETSADLRHFANEFATTALETARSRAQVAARRVGKLKSSLKLINHAGLELNKVARRHALRFVKQNASLAAQARDEVAALARETYTTLKKSADTRPKARKSATTARNRKRKSKAA